MPKQTPKQKETVERVMGEFKHGALKSAGRPVRNPRQAIAIALSEAGEARGKSPRQNRHALAKTKIRERNSGAQGPSRADLYQQATEHGIAGRSRMTKVELQRALKDHG